MLTHWQMIVDRLAKQGWSLGWTRVATAKGLLWSVDAHRRDGRKFIAQTEEMTAACQALEQMIQEQAT